MEIFLDGLCSFSYERCEVDSAVTFWEKPARLQGPEEVQSTASMSLVCSPAPAPRPPGQVTPMPSSGASTGSGQCRGSGFRARYAQVRVLPLPLNSLPVSPRTMD